MNYNLHKDLFSCTVKKSLILRLETFLKSDIDKIFDSSEEDKKKFSLSIKDDIGTLYLDSIDEYKNDRFPAKTSNIYINLRKFGSLGNELHIRFPRTGTPCIEVYVEGDKSKDQATAIFLRIKEILEEYKTYHSLLHGNTASMIIGGVNGVVLAMLYVKGSLTIQTAMMSFTVTILCSICFVVVTHYLYPKVEFESNALFIPRKIFHYILSTFIVGLLIVGFLKKKIFG